MRGGIRMCVSGVPPVYAQGDRYGPVRGSRQREVGGLSELDVAGLVG